jgi:hypothetical protein
VNSIKYIFDNAGNKTAAIVPIREFEELLDLAQDAIDVAEIESREGEEYFDWEEIKKEL